jgi:hypothetical protein
VYAYKSRSPPSLSFHDIEDTWKSRFKKEIYEMLAVDGTDRPSAADLQQRFARKRLEPVLLKRLPCAPRIYILLPFPTYDELRVAAYRWNMVAGDRLQFAFGGTFAARLRSGNVDVRDVKIIIQWGGFKETTKIKNDNPQYFGITEHNDHIMVVRSDETYSFGVSIFCVELGTEGYPYKFIPPHESPLRALEHGNLELTYDQISLGLPEEEFSVPILRSSYLLYQRLFRFHRAGFTGTILCRLSFLLTASEERRLKRDIFDIRVFLYCAALDQCEPFPNEIVPYITRIVGRWQVFAEDNFIETTFDDIPAWRRLGLQLSLSDVSCGQLMPQLPARRKLVLICICLSFVLITILKH